jgi:tetratricopeptide (TPR) repeat protein
MTTLNNGLAPGNRGILPLWGNAGVPAGEAATAEEATPVLLERRQRFSQSLLWKLQRTFFERQGIEAWREGTVPHYITNNPFIARAYARIVAAWMRAWLGGESMADSDAAPALDRTQPIRIIELGAGCGRFAFLFLKELAKLRRETGLEEVPFRYVLTDFTERTLEYLCSHPWLRPFVDAGILDFARYDAESDRAIRLLQSGQVLSPESVKNPVVVLANYFFDGIPQDVFAVRHGRLHELLLTLSSPRPEPDPDDPSILERVKLSYDEEEVSTEYYEEPVWNRILRAYQQRLPNTTFSFPSAALRCLQRFQQLASGRLLLLTADRGCCREDALLGEEEPRLAIHGSFSMRVNYHAIGEYCLHQEGQVLHPARLHTSLAVSAFLFGQPPAGTVETAHAYAEAVQGFGPDDFFVLKKGVEKLYESLTLPQLLAYLALSDWDPNILAGCASTLRNCLGEATAAQKQEVFRAVHQVWEHYYPLGERTDVAFQIGLLLHTMEYYAEAVRFYEQSRALCGASALTAYNRGLCHHRLRQLDQALLCMEEALGLDPDCEAARRLRILLETERDGSLE